MLKFQSHPGLSSADLRSLFGGGRLSGGTPGVSTVRANAWLPRAVDIYEINHTRPSATGAGNSFALDTYDGTTSVATFSFDNSDGTSKTTTYSPAALTAATSASNGEAHLQEQVTTGTPSAAGSFAVVYQDNSNNALTYHAAGDGSSNISVGASPKYVAVYGSTTTAPTAATTAQVAWPSAGNLSNFAVRYNTDGATAFSCGVHINGSNALSIALPAAATGLVTDTTSVAIAVDDLLTFEISRTSGSDTTFSVSIIFTFEAN